MLYVFAGVTLHISWLFFFVMMRNDVQHECNIIVSRFVYVFAKFIHLCRFVLRRNKIYERLTAL